MLSMQIVRMIGRTVVRDLLVFRLMRQDMDIACVILVMDRHQRTILLQASLLRHQRTILLQAHRPLLLPRHPLVMEKLAVLSISRLVITKRATFVGKTRRIVRVLVVNFGYPMVHSMVVLHFGKADAVSMQIVVSMENVGLEAVSLMIHGSRE